MFRRMFARAALAAVVGLGTLVPVASQAQTPAPDAPMAAPAADQAGAGAKHKKKHKKKHVHK